LWLRQWRAHAAPLRRAHGRARPLVAVPDAGGRLGRDGGRVSGSVDRPLYLAPIDGWAGDLWGRRRPHLRALARPLGVAAAAQSRRVGPELDARPRDRRPGPPVRRLLSANLAAV